MALLSTLSLPLSLEMLLSNDSGSVDSKASPLARLSGPLRPGEAAVLSYLEVSRLAGSSESSGLDLFAADTELRDASFKLSFSCFPGTIEVFLRN